MEYVAARQICRPKLRPSDLLSPHGKVRSTAMTRQDNCFIYSIRDRMSGPWEMLNWLLLGNQRTGYSLLVIIRWLERVYSIRTYIVRSRVSCHDLHVDQIDSCDVFNSSAVTYPDRSSPSNNRLGMWTYGSRKIFQKVASNLTHGWFE